MSKSRTIHTYVLWAACAAAGGGCAPAELPDPVIEGVSPAQIDHGSGEPLTVDMDAVYPFVSRFDEGTIEANLAVSATIGGLPLRAPYVDDAGDVIGGAPFGLAPGTYGVRVELADGRAAELAAALEVLPAPFPDGYLIDPIAPQPRAAPFEIVIRAFGPEAPRFTGVVRITIDRGNVEPDVSGPFLNSERRELVTVPTPGIDRVIRVEDAAGGFGLSNPFTVSP